MNMLPCKFPTTYQHKYIYLIGRSVLNTQSCPISVNAGMIPVNQLAKY